MGGFLSHSVDVESAYQEPDEYSRVSQFHDPRSPSMDINRTPITVYDPINTVLDPRSPSEGIDRTPITYQLPQKFRNSVIGDASSKITDPIPPLCLEDDKEASTAKDPLSQSFIEIDSYGENKDDSHSELVKVVDVKTTRIPMGISADMPSPILPLIPNEHVIETPNPAPLTSTAIDITAITNSEISKSKIPTYQVTKRAPILPFAIPVDNTKKKSDFQAVKGFGWKKSGGCVFPTKTDSDGRSPLLSRNVDNLAFSPIQANALSKIQPSLRPNSLRGRTKNADVERVPRTDMHNKENVTILWED